LYVPRTYIPATPGAGKSSLPGIFADRLIGPVIDHVLWVVPRNSLRDQGEADFPDWSRFRIRAAGNESDPCRGTAGYVTTYQAIAADPARHLATVSRGRWMIFLDEPHHCRVDGEWHRAVDPLVQRASLSVFASGTFSRGDGEPIAWIPYGGDGMPHFENDPSAAVIRYSRGDAIREGAIVPIEFRYLDGRAEWEDEGGERREADISSGDYSAQALFSALRSGSYAYELLDECTVDWVRHRREEYPAAKMLVVAHDIEQAQLYQAHLHRHHVDALIATSDDSPAARHAIARVKGRAAPASDVLVCVGMCYEGLSVREATHVCCLTHIRSVPWLEQCFARPNRTAPGKNRGIIYGPKDQRFLSSIRAIEAEQLQALKEKAAAEGGSGEGQGGARPWITPLGSEAYRSANDAGIIPEIFCETDAKYSRPDGGMTPREAERLLRTQIADHIALYLSRVNHGSKAAYTTIIYRKLKDLVGGKNREDCTVEELTRQWAFLKEKWPV
jgi:superfamily II DNA or RNA helicase